MPNETRNIVIILGHPDPQGNHFGHALAQAYAQGARDAGHDVQVISVAQLEFPQLRSREDQRGTPPGTIVQAQRIIAGSDHVVMFFPIWNGTAPAILKGFLEQTFRPAFVFPDAKTGEPLGFCSYFTQRKALKGKTARTVITMQMPAFIYRWYFRPHPEKNTLRVSGLDPIRESLIGLVDAPGGRKRERWLRRMYLFGQEGR